MNKYTILFSILLTISSHTFAQTHGYLGFWYDITNPQSVPQTKTTRENSSQHEAQTEIQQFCQNHDEKLPNGSTGCFAITPLTNTCAAAAWSHKRGLMRPDNVYIAQNDDFHKVGKMAYKMCKQNNGWFARCEVETIYCTDQRAYHSHQQ